MYWAMTVVTRQGDYGETQLATGERTSKTNPRVHAFGTVDELDALIGVLRTEEECFGELKEKLLLIQKKLYVLKSDLAGYLSADGSKFIKESDIEELEKWISDAESKLPKLNHFIIPGGTKSGAGLHFARTVCRRAERWAVELSRQEKINMACLKYLNRLSDLLFVMARGVNLGEEKVMPSDFQGLLK